MLDPDEPDTPIQETTTEQPSAQPTQRRRRAASRPAGPPSTAPDAPAIQRVDEPTEAVSADFTEAEITPPIEKSAKKPAAKRTAKKPPAETTADDKVAKTPRKRTAKKAMAKAPSDEAPAPSAGTEELAAASNGTLIGLIGNVAILYREQSDPEKRQIKLPS